MSIEDNDREQTQVPDSKRMRRSSVKKADVLSFRCVSRTLTEEGVAAEFALMRKMLKKAPAPEDFHRVGKGSGSHLLKLTTPRADINQCVLRFARSGSNSPPVFVPSLNAPDIPYAKIVYRPLEVVGWAPKSILDHIREPDELSETVLSAFAEVFGWDCLRALRSALLGGGHQITRLPDTGGFPIIFLPRPGGGDIQATPVSPAEAFTWFDNMATASFVQKDEDAAPVPRGRWIRQSISAKPQNISGMIGGSRQRFLAQMPSVMRDSDAAVLAYALGGKFPCWRDGDLKAAVLNYAARLDMDYTNRDIRAGTDRCADQLIAGALDFIAGVQDAAREILEKAGNGERALPHPPRPSALILRRRWKKGDREKAMKALTSPHFRDREQIALAKMEA